MDLLELPEPEKTIEAVAGLACFTADQMHSYVRADRAARQSEAEAILREIVDKAPHVTGEAWDAIWARARAWRDSRAAIGESK